MPAGSLRHLLQTISLDETAFVVGGVDELWVWLLAVTSPSIVSSEEPMTTGSEHAVIRAVTVANAAIETASLRLVFS